MATAPPRSPRTSMVCQAVLKVVHRVTPGYTERCNIKQTDSHELLHDTTHEEGENAAAETSLS